MKNILLVLSLNCASCIVNCAFSQPGQWTWIHGSNTFGSLGNYGVLGVPDPSNEPEACYEPAEWTDLNGNMWLFSGWNQPHSYNNDLWKYDPLTNEWTWMNGNGIADDSGSYGVQGVPSFTNLPPSRTFGCITWTDLNNNLWLFGGNHAGIETYNDLWKYDIGANEWTWMKGPSTPDLPGFFGTQGVSNPANYPGARFETAAGWTDNNGNLWLFGGARNNNCLNDLWKYNIATNEWTWMKGDSLPGAAPVFGTQTIEAPANDPGARIVYSTWKDLSGNFWLFGSGNYYLSEYRNDLWRYNITTNNWTWMTGSNLPWQLGVYGTQCTAAATNTPGYRLENRARWRDTNGNFWMMGGGYGGSSFTWNDLWTYCVSSNEWTWVDNSNGLSPAGNWGTLGVSSPLNMPNGRCAAVGWADQSGHLYFFGGTDNSFYNFYNDLWVYTIDTACANVGCSAPHSTNFFSASSVVCPGTCIDFTNLSIGAVSYQWLFPGGLPAMSTDVNPSGICYNNPGSYDVTLIATGPGGTDTLTIVNYITVYPYPPPQGIQQSGDTLFANQGAVTYQWYFNGNIIGGATDYYYVAPQSGDYNVVCTDSNDCEVEAAIFDVLAFTESLDESQALTIFPNPAINKLTIYSRQYTINSMDIYNVLGEKILIVQLQSRRSSNSAAVYETTMDISGLSEGMYYMKVQTENGTIAQKFIKE